MRRCFRRTLPRQKRHIAGSVNEERACKRESSRLVNLLCGGINSGSVRAVLCCSLCTDWQQRPVTLTVDRSGWCNILHVLGCHETLSTLLELATGAMGGRCSLPGPSSRF